MPEIYLPEGYFETTLSADLTASATTISLTEVPTDITKGYLVIEPASSTKREVVHFTSVGASSVTAAADTTDSNDATGRGCKGSITVGANTAHDQGVTVLIANSYNYLKRWYDTYGTDTTLDAPIYKTSTPTDHYIEINNSIYRQALINGDFQVAQRGTSFTSTSTPANNDDTYLLDRWNLISDGNDAVDVSQDTANAPTTSKYCVKFDTETAKRYGFVQFLENKDALKFNGKTVTFSFKAKTASSQVTALRAAVLSWSSTADSITSDVVGTWAATPTWAANWTAENTPADITITNSWATYEIEATIDTASMANIAVVVWTPNEETIGDVWYLADCQLCAGEIALPFMPKSYEDELRACKRYCVGITSLSGQAIAQGLATSTTAGRMFMPLGVEMRTPPTLTATASDWQLSDGASASVDVTVLATIANFTSTKGVFFQSDAASGLTQWRPYYLIADSAGKVLILSAEL